MKHHHDNFTAMAQKELIQSIEDREFTSGLGNWDGYDAWESGPIEGHSGLAVLDLPSGDIEKNIFLSYPAFKFPPDAWLPLTSIHRILPPEPVFILITWYLLDGIYELEGTIFATQDPQGWFHLRVFFATPPDFNQNNSSIKIKVIKNSPLSKTIYFDDFSLLMFVEPRVDHLPLMGVH